MHGRRVMAWSGWDWRYGLGNAGGAGPGAAGTAPAWRGLEWNGIAGMVRPGSVWHGSKARQAWVRVARRGVAVKA